MLIRKVSPDFWIYPSDKGIQREEKFSELFYNLKVQGEGLSVWSFETERQKELVQYELYSNLSNRGSIWAIEISLDVFQKSKLFELKQTNVPTKIIGTEALHYDVVYDLKNHKQLVNILLDNSTIKSYDKKTVFSSLKNELASVLKQGTELPIWMKNDDDLSDFLEIQSILKSRNVNFLVKLEKSEEKLILEISNLSSFEIEKYKAIFTSFTVESGKLVFRVEPKKLPSVYQNLKKKVLEDAA